MVPNSPAWLLLQVQRPLLEQTAALCRDSSGTFACSCLHQRQTLHRNTCGRASPGLSFLCTPTPGTPRDGCRQGLQTRGSTQRRRAGCYTGMRGTQQKRPATISPSHRTFSASSVPQLSPLAATAATVQPSPQRHHLPRQYWGKPGAEHWAHCTNRGNVPVPSRALAHCTVAVSSSTAKPRHTTPVVVMPPSPAEPWHPSAEALGY